MLLPNLLVAAGKTTVEVDVEGMTCPFCVYSVKKAIDALPGVEKIQVSLELNKSRIVYKEGYSPDNEAIKKVLKDAGFSVKRITLVK